MKGKSWNKIGINLVSLICIIVVTSIITGTVVVSFNNIYISTRKKEFANELYTIQKMAEEYKFKHENYPIVKELEDEKGWYELDLYELGVNETNRGRKSNENDIYIINENTGEVKYKNGVNIGNETYDSVSGTSDNLVLNKK